MDLKLMVMLILYFSYDKTPGCKLMPGGLSTQNPFDEEWIVMIDKLIKSIYVGKYRVLQVRTQVNVSFSSYSYFIYVTHNI
jgi:hypothetical protein